MPTIPKIIHFIWAGGEKIIPKTGLDNILNWTKINPDFIINIWVDSLTDPHAFEKYQTKLTELYGLNLEDTSIKLMDINHENGIPTFDICTPEVRYELTNLWPNYGASSDLLRYNILFKKGGAFFDCLDVFPSKDHALGEIFFPPSEEPEKKLFGSELSAALLLFHLTIHSGEHGKEDLGTEAIICTPEHPKMKALAERAASAYHSGKWTYKLLRYKYQPLMSEPTDAAMTRSKSFPRITILRKSAADLPIVIDENEVAKRRAYNTLYLTGPKMAKDCLQEEGGKLSDYYMPHDEERLLDWVTLPKDHMISWVKMRIEPHPYREAFEIAIRSIYFEIHEMKIFNLDAHIEQITCASLKANENKDEKVNIIELQSNIKKELIRVLGEDQETFQVFSETEIQLKFPTKAKFKPL